jgi:hypothetical protein
MLAIKDYFYGALLVAAGLFCLHIYHDGEAKVEAADKRTAMVAQAKDKAIEATAQAASNQIGVVYEKAVAIPAVADLGVVCHAPRSSPVPQVAGGAVGPVSAAPVVGVGPSYDPTGPALTIGRDDDALIDALQQEVIALMDALNGKTK